ncbi:MAG: hypothetical protein KJO32_04030, partial [Deltaproteobacteria bacterium]|nr:hypothetical protein [Deltaproteobacteria bacterium]
MHNITCMPHLYKKKVQGRTYWYLRETAREGRKVRVKWQKYLGTPETLLAKLEKAEADKMPLRIRSEEFGSIFMANELEKVIDTIGIVDSIVPGNKRETGPSVGEYFFYAWVNRLIEPKSKNMIGTWFSRTAIDTLRKVNTHELSSKRYWDKWVCLVNRSRRSARPFLNAFGRCARGRRNASCSTRRITTATWHQKRVQNFSSEVTA